ncbi:MBL fold metallo-hydrolase [Halorarius halobius]|uniref:MBL fold metallo-hydrolase n=1 Tax=Halorarius halobius TaxID=2962671 RepID=UPI0020CCA508|nr:MBL fold metallo-hydrolase [Halorarius halobius]
MAAVSPDDLADRIERGERVTLLDVRNRAEIDEWRIDAPGIERVEVPYMKFVAAGAGGDPADLLPEDVVEPVVAVCGRGEASDEVAAQLREAGVDARNLAEGMHGWARVYRRVELAADAGAATVYQYHRPSSGCLAYLVVSGEEALVVDPLRAFADRYRADAAELGADLAAAVDTHVHADHVSGLRDLADAGATPYMSATAVDRGVTFDVETVEDGDALTVGDAAVEVVATPGHTTGMVSLAVGDLLLCGDTLFVDGVPRPDLESGDEGASEHARDLHRTLTERLARFDDDAVVAPGHYGDAAERAPDGSYTAPLGELRERLWPFGVDADAFVERVLDGLGARPANFERVIAVNLGRESADDEAAFELELGPNNCAAAAD